MAYGAPTAGPPRRPSNLYRNLLIGFVVLLLVIGGTVGLVVGLSGGSSAGASLRAEPLNSASDPFAPPVGADQRVPPVQPAGATTVDGSHVGLYGGTLDTRTCDRNQLVLYLEQNPSKAAAWASVLGITTTDIPSYVNGLTPVLLRSDTLVTNHGYANGRATTIRSVLEAGTAVLVDDKGEPVTKCYCGNPLTPPTYYTPGYTPTYYGPRWSGFTGTSITIIQKTTIIIDTFTLVDPSSGKPFNRRRGTDGSQPGDDTPVGATTPNTTPATTPPTQAPAPPPSSAAGPTAEQRAISKLQNAASQCAPFPPPIKQAASQDFATPPGPDSNTFVLQVTDHTTDGDTQVFTWNVDRTTLQFTPTDDLAQAASNHCPQLR
jgi:hypothetical protein